MNIAALVPDREAPSSRYRFAQLVPALAGRGIRLEVVELERAFLARRRQWARLSSFDAVILHRKLLTRGDFSRLRSRVRRLAFDFDDAVLFRDSNRERFESRTRRRRFFRAVRGVDLVIAGNDYLASLAAEAGAVCRILPTVLDLSGLAAPDGRVRGETIGWLGTSSNLIYLADISAPLARAVSSAPGRRLVVVCDRDPELPGLNYEFRRWSPSVERDALQEFGVGIMPLRDDPWARGKCGFKLIQYGAAAIPVVASPVGMNRLVVRDGRTGFLASSPRQWTESLDRLLSDPRSRTEMGAEGRRRVEAEYSLEANLDGIVEVLKELVG